MGRKEKALGSIKPTPAPSSGLKLMPGFYLYNGLFQVGEIERVQPKTVKFKGHGYYIPYSQLSGIPLDEGNLLRLGFSVESDHAYLPGSGYELIYNPKACSWAILFEGKPFKNLRYVHELQYWHLGWNTEPLVLHSRITNYGKKEG